RLPRAGGPTPQPPSHGRDEITTASIPPDDRRPPRRYALTCRRPPAALKARIVRLAQAGGIRGRVARWLLRELELTHR
ncbi:MAG: hypothetical protein ACR2RL_25105, partial [Gammaproteobacteria bacterium]